MALFTPRSFAGTDRAQAEALIAAHPFATLITSSAGTEPQISHLPLLLEDGALVGHMARANPHWQRFAGGRTLALFHGPHAYVSPRWYVDPAANVPTWNYAAVHVAGPVALIEGEAVAGVVERLSRRFDPDFALQADVVRKLLPGIVAFRIKPERIDAKFKMSQNKTAADRSGVVAGLRAHGGPDEQAVAILVAGPHQGRHD